MLAISNLVGIGLVPNTELAAEAGLRVDDGIVIDDHARTSDDRIVAAGDCVSHRLARYDRLVRLESVPSATEQAKAAAATLCAFTPAANGFFRVVVENPGSAAGSYRILGN